MQSRVLQQALARITNPNDAILQDLYRRGVRFPTGKVHNIVMPLFEKEHLKTVRYVLTKHGFVEKRAREQGQQLFTDGEREVHLYLAVPEYADRIGILI